METCIDYTDYESAILSTDEQKWHRRVRKWAEEYPGLVCIKTEPEGNDGNMVAIIPVKWVKLSPPRACNMTDEQKAENARRLALARNKLPHNGEIETNGEGGEVDA
ncbi:MAG: hypothetical protein K6F19_06260 [Oscillospiraceae bacterium]|nr:hypothetical protein [Oscillospiraceae bacterium]